MTKIPSSKFSTAKKKIASTKFPAAKRKLSSGKLASPSAKITSKKFAKAKEGAKRGFNEPAPLGRPADEQTRLDEIAILKIQTDALKTASKRTAR